jgi:nucleoside-diphosphate-sugar epimerase
MFLWDKEYPGIEIFNFVEKPDLTSREIAASVASALGRTRAGITLPMPVVLALALPFDAITALTGRDLGVSTMRVRKLFSQETVFEADKLATSGFRSPVPLGEGIGRMVRWWLEAGRSQEPKWRQPPSEVQQYRQQ